MVQLGGGAHPPVDHIHGLIFRQVPIQGDQSIREISGCAIPLELRDVLIHHQQVHQQHHRRGRDRKPAPGNRGTER